MQSAMACGLLLLSPACLAAHRWPLFRALNRACLVGDQFSLCVWPNRALGPAHERWQRANGAMSQRAEHERHRLLGPARAERAVICDAAWCAWAAWAPLCFSSACLPFDQASARPRVGGQSAIRSCRSSGGRIRPALSSPLMRRCSKNAGSVGQQSRSTCTNSRSIVCASMSPFLA